MLSLLTGWDHVALLKVETAPFRVHFAPFKEHFTPFREQFAPFRKRFAPFRERLAPFRKHFAPFRKHFRSMYRACCSLPPLETDPTGGGGEGSKGGGEGSGGGGGVLDAASGCGRFPHSIEMFRKKIQRNTLRKVHTYPIQKRPEKMSKAAPG
jgi:hypothetical protein